MDEGLLSTYYAREAGRRGGPGSGRPPKWYVADPHRFDITLPPRRNDLAAMILLRVAARSGAVNRERVMEEARQYGNELAGQAAGQDLPELLTGLGYDPRPRGPPRRCRCHVRRRHRHHRRLSGQPLPNRGLTSNKSIAVRDGIVAITLPPVSWTAVNLG